MYDVIYIIVDRYTKMVLYLPIVKTITATKFMDLFLDEVIYYFRTPKGIISNYGNIFTSEFWLKLCFAAKIKHRLNIAFYL